MKTYSSRKRHAVRNFVIGVLSCAALAAWTYNGARQKSLNIGLLKAVKQGDAKEIEAWLQRGANPSVHVYAYPHGAFASEMHQRFQWDLLRPSYWRYTFRYDFASHDETDSGPPLIWKSVEDRDSALFDVLLRYGADANTTYEAWPRKNVTLLMFVAQWGDTGAIKSLLQRHPHINIRDSLGATPLHHAIYEHHLEAARLLLQSRANPNVWDNYGYTPLMNVATISDKTIADAGATDMAALLLKHHADINQRNKYHKTALTIAREQHNDRLIPFLLQHGATK